MAWFRAACELKVAVKRTSLRSPLTATSRHVRYVHVIPRSHSTPVLPWDCPNAAWKLVTHFDSSPDMKGKLGGGIASVTRDTYGMVVDQNCKFITGVIDPTELDLWAFKEFTSNRPKFIRHNHTLVSDNSASVYCLYAQAHLNRPAKNENLRNLTTTVLRQLEENFDPDTMIKWVPRETNHLADSLAQFARWEYLERKTEEKNNHTGVIPISKKEEKPALSRSSDPEERGACTFNRPKRDV